jgi:hypothetical protein
MRSFLKSGRAINNKTLQIRYMTLDGLLQMKKSRNYWLHQNLNASTVAQIAGLIIQNRIAATSGRSTEFRMTRDTTERML